MKKYLISVIFIFTLLFSLSAKAVKRGGDADMTPYLNESDARVVCKDIVDQIIQSPRIVRFSAKNNRDPVVTIGLIKDETGEFFDTQIIANSLKTAILKSGVLEFMANKDVRDEMRKEVVEQADHASEDQAKAMDEEDAADYMLTGSVKLMVQNNGKMQERTYIVNIELTDLQTHRTVDMFEPSEDVKDYLKKVAKIKSK
ncbi:penicillin-binding protein activator LpoB [Treponema sp.]|uniref:penicillin-binding protein activator LpoB n=1 Tax=Treponema sp. TaxID=166 RepID=UPI0025D009E5|nr:penicillin-binding protein activator LpoB [Treponema sp.]MBR4323419.1 penicillin-binding protein activator LpoB [Treponema sp.]MBR4600135.1 penicillin-binding protein activator LpoB [Treponema sp.]